MTQPHGTPPGHPSAHPPKKRSTLRFALKVAGLLAKGFGALIALVMLGILGLYFALPSIVDGNRVKTMLVDQLEKTLHRPVRIERVILTPQGVKLTKFRVMEPAGENAFIEGEFALVTIKLPALLQRRVELSNVRLASPRIRIARDAQGRWSFADMFSSTAAVRTAPAKPFELPVSLAADQTAIESGRLEFDDQLRGTKYLVEKFNLAVKQFDVEAPFNFAVSFDNESTFGERKVATSVSAEGVMSLAAFDWPQAFLKASKAQIKVDGRLAKGTVAVSSFTAPSVEADLMLPALGKDDWDFWWHKPVELSLPPSRWKVRAQWLEPRKVRVDRVEVKAGPFSGHGAGLVDLTGKLPQVSGDISADDFPLDQGPGFRESLKRYGLKGLARGEATVSGWPGRWAFSKTHLRVRGLGAAFAHWNVTNGDADVTAGEDFADVAVTLSSGALEAYKNSFSELTLSLRLVRKDLKVDYLALKWEDSRVRVRGRVVNLPDPRDVWISGSVDHVHWERAQQLVEGIIASVSTRTAVSPTPAADDEEDPKRLWVQTFKYAMPKKFPDTIGHIHIGKVLHKNFNFAEMDLLWDLRGITNKLDTANGEISASFGPGRVNDIQAVQDSNKFLRIVFLPYIYMYKMNSLSVLSAGAAYPKELDFNRIEGQYGVRRGVVDTRFCSVDSPQLLAFAAGTADFARESVDMGILTRLTKYKATLPEWWVDEKGRPAIGFRVKGDLNHPDLEPRLHKIGADEIEKALESSRGNAKARFEALDKLAQLDAPEKKKGANKK